jgi:protocatechuate 3,4-dioxygenase alpha subunit
MTTAEFRYAVTDAEPSHGPTPYQTVGPFFHDALPYPDGPRLAGPDRPGAFVLSGRVLDGAGDPIDDGLVEIWQADDHGRLQHRTGLYEPVTAAGFRGFGRCATDPDGRYWFRTVKPAPVSTVDGRSQAPYIAMSVFARGMLRRAVTRVYFADEAAANTADPLLSALTENRRPTLLAAPTGGGYRFDVRVSGTDETVLLDVTAC